LQTAIIALPLDNTDARQTILWNPRNAAIITFGRIINTVVMPAMQDTVLHAHTDKRIVLILKHMLDALAMDNGDRKQNAIRDIRA